jgi:hypothetical protein
MNATASRARKARACQERQAEKRREVELSEAQEAHRR